MAHTYADSNHLFKCQVKYTMCPMKNGMVKCSRYRETRRDTHHFLIQCERQKKNLHPYIISKTRTFLGCNLGDMSKVKHVLAVARWIDSEYQCETEKVKQMCPASCFTF